MNEYVTVPFLVKKIKHFDKDIEWYFHILLPIIDEKENKEIKLWIRGNV